MPRAKQKPAPEQESQRAQADAPPPLAVAAASSEPAPIGDVLPAWLANVSWLAWLKRLTGEQRVALALTSLAAVLFVPWIGATGFWDCWEPHYGEVAREMIARGDYIHPWWESSYFFSKPALDLWLMAAGELVAGINDPARGIAPYTEWCVRLPWAVVAAMGPLVLYFAVNRLFSRRIAILATVAMLTAPLMTFLARQAVPDPIFVGLLTASMACLAIVLFEREDLGALTAGRDGWLIAFYALAGLATLSKGLLGFALPGAVTLVYCVLTGEWFRLRRLRLVTGALIVLAICAPWYGTMFAFPGVDDEGKTFFQRFIIHDHFKRLVEGVHTTTPGGSFTYFIEQLGFDCFPWVVAFPGAFAVAARVQVRPKTARERALLFTLLWAIIGFAVFAFSATKFHHYAFPVLPPLLILSAIWLDNLLDEGLRAHAGELLLGGLLYGLVAQNLAMSPKHLTDMFVYNYDRPYPDRETDPRSVFQVLFFAGPAVALSPWVFDRLAQLWAMLKARFSKAQWPAVRDAMQARLDGAPLERAESRQDRHLVVASLVGLALLFALYNGWVFWRKLSPHWTQRDLFYAYYQDSTPDEPIGAYLMNWRGETFYSRNTVRQVGGGSMAHTDLGGFMNQPGKRKWLLVEQARIGVLRQALGTAWKLRVVESKNNKFALTVAEPVQQPPGSTPAQLQSVPPPTGPVGPLN